MPSMEQIQPLNTMLGKVLLTKGKPEDYPGKAAEKMVDICSKEMIRENLDIGCSKVAVN